MFSLWHGLCIEIDNLISFRVKNFKILHFNAAHCFVFQRIQMCHQIMCDFPTKMLTQNRKSQTNVFFGDIFASSPKTLWCWLHFSFYFSVSAIKKNPFQIHPTMKWHTKLTPSHKICPLKMCVSAYRLKINTKAIWFFFELNQTKIVRFNLASIQRCDRRLQWIQVFWPFPQISRFKLLALNHRNIRISNGVIFQRHCFFLFSFFAI